MAESTKIAWTDHTANFWMGCTKVSTGCAHCYAETLTKNRMGLKVWGPRSVRQEAKAVWDKVKAWNNAARDSGIRRRTFCMSLGDFFEDHQDANRIRQRAWETIRNAEWLDWQILTKRAENISTMLPEDWGTGWPHVWLGVSIENNDYVHRADALRQIPATVRFISYEPALGPLDKLNLTGIDWVIVGGESGSGYRPMDVAWARAMRDRCAREGVVFFFKQSAAPRTEMGIKLDGRIRRAYPSARRLPLPVLK